MDYKMDSGWKLHPIGGDTGHAYMGVRAEEKVFLKRNSSPFLAALSVEGITPRLIWTKRIGNGDVLTAQEWLNGRVLNGDEMQSEEILSLLKKIHYSDHLLNMLRKVKGQVYDPEMFMMDYLADLDEELRTNSFLTMVATYLEESLPIIKGAKYAVCHGDLNRKNFILTNDSRLYLVDWEMVKIADPMSDLAMILVKYVNPDQWYDWLKRYGLLQPEELKNSIEWYSMMNRLILIKRYHSAGENIKMNGQILFLKEAYEDRLHQQEK